MQSKLLSISPAGEVAAIYDDDVRGLYDALGEVSIARASNVEPDEAGQWRASMTDGAVLGPFRLRAEALAAEVTYLQSKLFS